MGILKLYRRIVRRDQRPELPKEVRRHPARAASERRKRPQKPARERFAITPGAECAVLVLDISSSMLDTDYAPTRLGAGLMSARGYLETKVRHSPGDRVAVVVFDEVGMVIRRLAAPERILKAWPQVTRQINPGGGTLLLAGLSRAMLCLPAAAWDAEVSRRIILLTDGWGGNPSGFAGELKASGVRIDAIGIGGSPSDVDEKTLESVASPGGYRFITSASELFSHFESLARGLVK